MTDKLKPCPFCGGEASLDKIKTVKGWFEYLVWCADDNCACQNASYRTKEEAIEAWNTRKPMDRENKENE